MSEIKTNLNHFKIDESNIVFEDNHLLIVNKKNGILVQVDQTGDTSIEILGKEYIKTKYDKPGNVFLGVCHRLDRPVSGIVILCKTSKSLVRMNEVFRDKTIQKTYLAIVKGVPANPNQKLVHWLKKNEKMNISKAHINKVEGGQEAILEYETIKSSDRYSILKINLHTGRHHQIRAQLASIGHPIVGDVKYGFSQPNRDGSIMLHSYQSVFEHPTTKEIVDVRCIPNIKTGFGKLVEKEFSGVIFEES